MKVKNIILLTLIIVGYAIISYSRNENSEKQILKKIYGRLIDVSLDESQILYERPKDINSEFSNSILICRQIKSNTEIIISDSINFYSNFHAKFFNDTLIIVPTDNDILIYNLKQKKYLNKLTDLKSNEYIFAFNISQDKQTIVFIVGNPIQNKFNIYCLDLLTNMLNKDEHTIIEQNDAEYYCSIYIINNHIVFNINNNLYLLIKGKKKDKLITNHLSFNAYGMFLYAVDSNNIIFIEGYEKETKVKSYDLKDGIVKFINFSLNVPIKYNDRDIKLNNFIFNTHYKIQLFSDFSYIYENSNFLTHIAG